MWRALGVERDCCARGRCHPILAALPGAFVGGLLGTGSAAQAGAVQALVVIALLVSQTCGARQTVGLTNATPEQARSG
jgi:hypothetical protein